MSCQLIVPESDTGDPDRRRNGTSQHVENATLGETHQATHTRGKVGFLRHSVDGTYRLDSDGQSERVQSGVARAGPTGEAIIGKISK